MLNKNQIISQQQTFIAQMKKVAVEFIASINKSEIQTILLSGSVARGDYFPDKKENDEDIGMVDLIVMKKIGSFVKAKDIFGENQEPEIPYHCVKFNNVGFQILFTDFITSQSFADYDEARKFSILESQILFDPNKKYENELTKINKIKIAECETKLQNKIGYIHYLISDYKKDRWYRRGAFLQLHENLNTAIRMAVYCLFYLNNSYAPAEDRQLYYSLTLSKLPTDYENVIFQLKNQISDSEDDYNRREALFRKEILKFIERR